MNNGLRALRRVMRRCGLGYVLAITSVVALAGAAGMQTLERGDTRLGAFDSFGSSLWFTLMLLTSVDSEYWPRTAGGRWLCLVLSVYGFAVFGYITVALASFFVDRDAGKKNRRRRARCPSSRRRSRRCAPSWRWPEKERPIRGNVGGKHYGKIRLDEDGSLHVVKLKRPWPASPHSAPALVPRA